MALGGTASKQQLRTEILTARRNMTSSARHSKNVTICSVLTAEIQRRNAQIVAAYVPLDTEPGGELLLSALATVVPTLLLPIVTPGFLLDWAAYQGGQLQRVNGVWEPTTPQLGHSAITWADLVIVPALAVDRAGIRLGRGAGYYDRALQKVTAPVVALLFDREFLPTIPKAPHDQRVSAVITPTSGWYELSVR